MAQAEKFQAGYEFTSVTDDLFWFRCMINVVSYSILFIKVGLRQEKKKNSGGFWSAHTASSAATDA
jgi:hypothetical protein